MFFLLVSERKARARAVAAVAALCLPTLAACGGGSGEAGTASAPPPVQVVSGSGSSVAPVPTPVPTPAPTPTPVPTPTPTPSAARPVVVSEGDSLSVFWGGSHTGLYAASSPGVTFHGQARGGARISDPGGGNGLFQRFEADAALRPTHVTVLIGANDLGDGNYPSAQAWLDALWAYTAKWKALGAEVAVGTVLPICLHDARWAQLNATHAERRALVNPAIRAAVGTRIDAVIDFAADPVVGPDQAACDPKIFHDGLHPSDDMQAHLAAIYKPTLDKMIKE